MLRVLLDANIFISYLLNPHPSSVISQIVKTAVLGHYTLLLPEALLHEFVTKILEKPYLADRISAEELQTFVGLLHDIGEVIPAIKEAIPAVTRDPKDDYLLAYALVGDADYLVTGDHDLLVLKEVGTVKIVTVRQFANLLIL